MFSFSIGIWFPLSFYLQENDVSLLSPVEKLKLLKEKGHGKMDAFLELRERQKAQQETVKMQSQSQIEIMQTQTGTCVLAFFSKVLYLSFYFCIYPVLGLYALILISVVFKNWVW